MLFFFRFFADPDWWLLGDPDHYLGNPNDWWGDPTGWW